MSFPKLGTGARQASLQRARGKPALFQSALPAGHIRSEPAKPLMLALCAYSTEDSMPQMNSPPPLLAATLVKIAAGGNGAAQQHSLLSRQARMPAWQSEVLSRTSHKGHKAQRSTCRNGALRHIESSGPGSRARRLTCGLALERAPACPAAGPQAPRRPGLQGALAGAAARTAKQVGSPTAQALTHTLPDPMLMSEDGGRAVIGTRPPARRAAPGARPHARAAGRAPPRARRTCPRARA